MPIIIYTEGGTNISTPIFVGPDREGSFPIYPNKELYDIPESLDPLGELGIKAVLNGRLPEEEVNRNITLDYKEINPENKEEVLRVTDGTSYDKKFYLSPRGNGGALGKNLTHNMTPHQYELISFSPIRVEGSYRRTREGDRCLGKVIGWEANESFYVRKPKTERRV